MTRSNKVQLLVAAFAAILAATNLIVVSVTQPAAAQRTSSSITITQTDNCHTHGDHAPLTGACQHKTTTTNSGTAGTSP